MNLVRRDLDEAIEGAKDMTASAVADLKRTRAELQKMSDAENYVASRLGRDAVQLQKQKRDAENDAEEATSGAPAMEGAQGGGCASCSVASGLLSATAPVKASFLGKARSPVASKAILDRMRGLGALGRGAAGKFDRRKYADLVPNDPAAPFSGQGATGIRGPDTSVPAGDLTKLWLYKKLEERQALLRRDGASMDPDEYLKARREQSDLYDALRGTVDTYRNPLSEGLNVSHESLWDKATRVRQAELFLNQPISTAYENAYGDELPTRAEVIDAAARRYDLDPNVLAGVLLQEQRDQSQREDFKDFLGAARGGANTSVGLGQITMGTAMRNDSDILSDTVSAEERRSLSRAELSTLLTSDEHNIFGVARYLRTQADEGARLGADPQALRMTRAAFPEFSPAQLKGSRWDPDTVRVMASEYSSKPWDDRVLPEVKEGYPNQVYESAQDARATGAFTSPAEPAGAGPPAAPPAEPGRLR